MDHVRAKLAERVGRCLQHCLEWSQDGRHRKVLEAVEHLLPETRDHPHLAATLLVWKAQALLAMGCADRAFASASRSWELGSSPHACHLQAAALMELGEVEQAEHLLEIGCELFPRSAHLALQLAMVLADVGRVPEALSALDRIDDEDPRADDLLSFVTAFRANLLAAMGRWPEAQAMLAAGLRMEPDSELMLETRQTIVEAWSRHQAVDSLLNQWRRGLQPIAGASAEVDEAVLHFGAVLDRPRLLVLAARRLWRAFDAAHGVRVVTPDPWAVAALQVAMEVDGESPSTSVLARCTGTNASTVRSCLRRLRAFVGEFDAHFVSRAFAAFSNPMLDAQAAVGPSDEPCGQLVEFPGTGRKP